MTGAVIAGVSAVYSAWSGNKAASKAEDANNRAMDLAIAQYDYQKHNVGMFQDSLMATTQLPGELEWGGGGYSAKTYSAQGYKAEGYTAAQIEELALAQGDNQAGIDAAQRMLDDWADTFGGLEDNLSNYYNDLDPDKFSTQSKIYLQESIDKSMKQFNETMAASGLQSSGMKQQAAKEAAFLQATGNAQIDIGAEETVAQMQQGFLSYGQAEKQQAQDLLAGATNLDSQIKTQVSSQNASAENAMNVFNADATNQSLAFNANANNQANSFNANARNQAASFNAGARNQASAFNASSRNQAIQMQSSATLNAVNNFNNSFLTASQIQDPRIAIESGNATNYGASSAGYMQAAGTAIGAGINMYASAT